MKTKINPAQFILAAFCYVTAMMIWEIGKPLVYVGVTQSWFVIFICLLVVSAGISYHFEGAVFERDTQ
jgi:cytochrome c biogenesis protein ResB